MPTYHNALASRQRPPGPGRFLGEWLAIGIVIQLLFFGVPYSLAALALHVGIWPLFLVVGLMKTVAFIAKAAVLGIAFAWGIWVFFRCRVPT